MTVDVRTGEIVQHSTEETARARARRIRVNAASLEDDLRAAVAERDDLALGFGSMAEYLDDVFSDVRAIRLDRETRDEIVASLRAAGMTVRETSKALGIGLGTAHRAGVPNGTPAEPEPDPVEQAVEQYPDLAAWRDRPDQLLATAAALDGYGEQELPVRLDALAKHAAARREGRMPAPHVVDTRPDEIFDHVNAAARLLLGHEDTVVAAADPVIADTWRDQYERTGQALLDLAARLRHPSLRSVK